LHTTTQARETTTVQQCLLPGDSEQLPEGHGEQRSTQRRVARDPAAEQSSSSSTRPPAKTEKRFHKQSFA
jgi:hypothetical protein